MKRFVQITTIFVLVALCAVAAIAQGFQGGVRGAVTDPGGAVIPGVEIQLINEGTNAARSTITNEAGQYVFSGIAPGAYKIKASLPGFKTFERSGITISTSTFPIVDVKLDVGAVTDEINVVSEAPLVETSTASTGQVLSAAVLDVLPNSGRNAFMLAQTVPNVISVGDPTWNRQQDQNDSSRISLSGGPVRGNNYTLDGVSVTDARNRAALVPSIEAISEVKIQTSTFDAEMGRTGGGVFNTVGKSGTNAWHGSGFVQNRPPALTANDFFNNRAGIPLNKNFYFWLGGGSFGGPIIKDKTFFWASTEGYRQQTQKTATQGMPTTLEKQGDFSQTVNCDANGQNCRQVVIYDPATTRANPNGSGFIRDPFPGNKIPAARFNVVAKNLLQYFVAPDTDGQHDTAKDNYAHSALLTDKANQATVKIDHTFSQKFAVSGMWAYQRTREPNPNYTYKDYDPGSGILARTASVYAFNGTFTPDTRTVISARYGYMTFGDNCLPATEGFDLAKLGFDASYVNAVPLKKFPSVSFSGYRSLGDRSFATRTYTGHNANFAYSRFVGKHSVKVGADYRIIGAYFLLPGQASGSFSFTTNTTQLNPSASSSTTAGSAFASFLLGLPASGSLTLATPVDGFAPYHAVYIQDDLRITPRLTINGGIRYEHEGGFREKQDRITVGFDPDIASPLKVSGLNLKGGLIYPGQGGLGRSQGNPTNVKFGPRVGMAWSAGHNFTVRGGYGIFYAPEQYSSPSVTTWGPIGFNSTNNIFNADSNNPTVTLNNPFPNGLIQPSGNSLALLTNAGQDVNYVDRTKGSGKVQQYTLDITREFRGAAITAAYVGSRSDHMSMGGTNAGGVNFNQLKPDVPLGSYLQNQVPNPFFGVAGAGLFATARTIAQGQLLRPFPQFLGVTANRIHQGIGRYNSGVIKVERRMRNGFSIRSNYTFSKNMDNYIGEDSFFSSTSSGVKSAYNLKEAYSLSSFDAPHRLILSGIYDLPFGAGRTFMHGGGVADKVFGGWQLSAIGTFQSGYPLEILQSDNTGSLGGSQRPNRVLGVDPKMPGKTQDNLNQYINPAAYSQAPQFTFGNIARTAGDIRTPRQPVLNLSLNKTTSITEKVKATLRIEANNVTNTPKFSGPGTTLGSAAFGKIAAMAGFARQFQWMARFHW